MYNLKYTPITFGAQVEDKLCLGIREQNNVEYHCYRQPKSINIGKTCSLLTVRTVHAKEHNSHKLPKKLYFCLTRTCRNSAQKQTKFSRQCTLEKPWHLLQSTWNLTTASFVLTHHKYLVDVGWSVLENCITIQISKQWRACMCSDEALKLLQTLITSILLEGW
jgi:hypothetical protein